MTFSLLRFSQCTAGRGYLATVQHVCSAKKTVNSRSAAQQFSRHKGFKEHETAEQGDQGRFSQTILKVDMDITLKVLLKAADKLRDEI